MFMLQDGADQLSALLNAASLSDHGLSAMSDSKTCSQAQKQQMERVEQQAVAAGLSGTREQQQLTMLLQQVSQL